MEYKNIENIFNTYGEVYFKLFSLEYIIKKNDTGVEIYPIEYSNKKNYYSSFEETLNNFTIYNEPIMNNLDRITNVRSK